MTQSVGELQTANHKELRPLDDLIADGIALNGLFDEVKQQQVSSRLILAFENLRNDPDLKKEKGLCIALHLGELALSTEDHIDQLTIEVANEQNHGMKRVNTIQEDLVDVIWTGYDPNTTRLLKIYKRTAPILMTTGDLHRGTLWALKAKPGSIRS